MVYPEGLDGPGEEVGLEELRAVNAATPVRAWVAGEVNLERVFIAIGPSTQTKPFKTSRSL